jgi:hypothetical protein
VALNDVAGKSSIIRRFPEPLEVIDLQLKAGLEEHVLWFHVGLGCLG